MSSQTRQTFDARVATFNGPLGTGGSTARLLPPLRRAMAMFRVLNHLGVTLVFLQETGPVMMAAARLRSGWWSTLAFANTVLRRGSVGNGGAGKRKVWGRLNRRRIRVPMPGRPRGLNPLVRLLKHKPTGGRVVGISNHAPTRKADPSDRTRAATADAVTAYADRCVKAGLPVVMGIDANDADLRQEYLSRGWTDAGHAGVDWLLVRGPVEVLDSGATLVPGVTDGHHLVWADLRIAVVARWRRRLPRVPRRWRK